MAETPRTAVRLEDRRPLSPHLQIYGFSMTMLMSIAHRITGAALYFGILLIAWYLIAASYGPEAFGRAYSVMGSIPGQIILFLFTWSLFHHFFGGIRHAVWDTGVGMERGMRDKLAWATLIAGLVLTILVWIAAYALR